MSLASDMLDRYGLSCVVLTPDPEDPQFLHVDADKAITPGQASLLRTRCWFDVLDHRRSYAEPALVLESVWTLRWVGPAGDRVWRVSHDPCAAREGRAA